MARIRTVKPEFFRHEGLQDLEIAHPGSYTMLVFSALWGHCDKAGRFEWKPRTLKLDILPFLSFDMAETLGVLWQSGFIRRYSIDGKEYGEIASFEKHQRISGKEAQEPVKHPEPVEYIQGSNGEATGKQSPGQEGKGREGKGKEGNGVGGDFPEKQKEKRASQLPAGFYPNEAGITYAEKRAINIAIELESFRNWHQAKGTTMKDWQAGWRTWCDKAVEFGRTGNSAAKNAPRMTQTQINAQAFARSIGLAPVAPIQGDIIEGEFHESAPARLLG